jgi:hypothetical protein
MKEPRSNAHVSVSVSPSLEPGVFFYRRRYHLTWLRIQPPDANSSFSILMGSDGKPAIKP